MDFLPGRDAALASRARPVTASRIRVLTAYRRQREGGTTPAHAMEAVLVMTHRLLGQAITSREVAALEWDRFYARRYLAKIDLCSIDLPYWRS